MNRDYNIYSMPNHKPAISESLYAGNRHHIYLPFCLQHPIKLIMFLCGPIFFITSNSETRSADVTSVASSVTRIQVKAPTLQKQKTLIEMKVWQSASDQTEVDKVKNNKNYA